jgi:hypothetical protein
VRNLTPVNADSILDAGNRQQKLTSGAGVLGDDS